MNAAARRSKWSASQLAIGLTGYCAFINLYSPQSILPLLSGEFHATAAEVSSIITVSTLAVALTAPFTGAIADVLGRKRVIVAAMFVLVIPTLMVGLSQSLSALIFWRAVQGLVLPPIFAVAVAYIGDEWPPREATTVAGIYSSGSSLGGFSGRLVTGFLADLIGWRAGFFALAAIALAGATAVAFLLPHEKKFVRSEGIVASGRQMLAHFRNGQLVATFAVGFGVLFNFICTFTYVSFHLAAAPYNLSASWLGAMFVVYLTGSALTPWVGWPISRFGRRPFTLQRLGAVDRRHRADAGAVAAADHRRAGAERRLRADLPGDLDRLCNDNGQGRALVGGRTLRHLLLYRRQLRRGARRPCLDARRLAGLRGAGDRDAACSRRHRLFRLDASAAGRDAADAGRLASGRTGRIAGALVPQRPVAGLEHGKDRRRRQHVDARCRADAGADRRNPVASSAAGARRAAQKHCCQARSWRRRAAYRWRGGACALPLPARRSACRMSSMAGARRAPGKSAAKASASARRHSKHGR